MIEPYQWYVDMRHQLGFVLDNIGPASVDLQLGEVKCWNSLAGAFITVPAYDGKIIFTPGRFYLCSTAEYVYVPDTHCAFVNMRSSLARRGLGHKMAGFIDPGFEGQVTLELSCDIPVAVQQDERIVQIIYCRLIEPTAKPYQGRYKGQVGATEAYL